VAIHPRSLSTTPHVSLSPGTGRGSHYLHNTGSNSWRHRQQSFPNLKPSHFQFSDDFDSAAIGKPSPVAVAAVAAAAPVKDKSASGTAVSASSAASAPAPASTAASAAASQALPVPRPQSPSWRIDDPRVGCRIVRTVDGGVIVRGVVVGWLSALESDFVDANGQSAGLWRVRYASQPCFSSLPFRSFLKMLLRLIFSSYYLACNLARVVYRLSKFCVLFAHRVLRYDSEGPLSGDEEDFEEHEIISSVQAELPSAGGMPTAAAKPATSATVASSKSTATPSASANRKKGKKGASATAEVLQQPPRHALLIEKMNCANSNASFALTASTATKTSKPAIKRQRKSQSGSGSQPARRQGNSAKSTRRRGTENPRVHDGDEASTASSDELPSSTAARPDNAEAEASSNPYVVGRSTCGALELWAADRPKTPPVVHTSPRLGARPSRIAPAPAGGKGTSVVGAVTSSAGFQNDGDSSSDDDDDADGIDSISSAEEGEYAEGSLAAIGHQKRRPSAQKASLAPKFAPISDDAAQLLPQTPTPPPLQASSHTPREYCGVSRSAVEALAASGALSPEAARELLRPPVVARITRSTPEAAQPAATAKKIKDRASKEHHDKKSTRGNKKGARANGSNRKGTKKAHARAEKEGKKKPAIKRAAIEVNKVGKGAGSNPPTSKNVHPKGNINRRYESSSSSSSSDEDEGEGGSRFANSQPSMKSRIPSQPASLMELLLQPPSKKKRPRQQKQSANNNRARTIVKAEDGSFNSDSDSTLSSSDGPRGNNLKRNTVESKKNSSKLPSRSFSSRSDASSSSSSSSSDSGDDRTLSDDGSSDSDSSFRNGQASKASISRKARGRNGDKEGTGWSDGHSSGSEYCGPRAKKPRTSGTSFSSSSSSKARVPAAAFSTAQKKPAEGRDSTPKATASMVQKHSEHSLAKNNSSNITSTSTGTSVSAKKGKSRAADRAAAAKVAKAAAAAHAADVAAARAREVAAAAEAALAAGPPSGRDHQEGLFDVDDSNGSSSTSKGWERVSEPISNIPTIRKNAIASAAASSGSAGSADDVTNEPVSLMTSRTAVAVEGSNKVWNPHDSHAPYAVAAQNTKAAAAPPPEPLNRSTNAAVTPVQATPALHASYHLNQQRAPAQPSSSQPLPYSRSPYPHHQPPLPQSHLQPQIARGGAAAPHDPYSHQRGVPLPPSATLSPHPLHASAHPHHIHAPASSSVGYPLQGQRFTSGMPLPPPANEKGHVFASPAPPWANGAVGAAQNNAFSQRGGGQPSQQHRLPAQPPAAGYGKPPPVAGTQPYSRYPYPNGSGAYPGSGSNINSSRNGSKSTASSSGSFGSHQNPSPYPPSSVAGVGGRTMGMRASPYPRTFGASPTPVGMNARWKAGPSPRPLSKPAVPPGFLF